MARLTQSYLRWIRPGLDDLIQQAQVALNDHATQPDSARLKECLRLLHLIHASLQMVQIYGTGLLLEEMLLLGQALMDNKITKVDEALESLMDAIVLISDRMDRIQQGEDDSPITMLSLLNDLRACRDAPLMSSLSLFGGDLDQQIASLYSIKGNINPQMPLIAEKLRASFHKGLLHWLRHPDAKDGLLLVQAVLDKFVEYAGAKPTKTFFRALAALAQSLASDSLETGVTVKRLMSRVDREIKLLAEGGESAFIEDPEPELIKSILYYVANSSSQDPRVTETLTRFELKRLHGIKTDSETLAGVNQELLLAVSDALREDMLHIKDGLDDYIKGETNDVQSLEPLHKSLVRLADTIGMLGQGGLRIQLKQESEKLADWIAKTHAPQEHELMDLAASVLNVELSLDQLGKHQGGALHEESLPAFTRDELMIATLRESAIEMAHIKEQLGLYLEHPANGLPANLQGRFSMILGALGILQLAEPQAMLTTIAHFVSGRMGQSELPPASQLTHLADLISSIEYFMESIAQELGLEEQILDFARKAQTALRASAQQPEPSPPDPPSDDQSSRPDPSPIAVADQIEAEVAPAKATEEVIELEAVAIATPELSLPEPEPAPALIPAAPVIPAVTPAAGPEADQPGLVLIESEMIGSQAPISTEVEPEIIEIEPLYALEEAVGITENEPTEAMDLELPRNEPELVLIEPVSAEPQVIEPLLPENRPVKAAEPDRIGIRNEHDSRTLEIEAEHLLEAVDLEPLVAPEPKPIPLAPQPAQTNKPAPAQAPVPTPEDVDSEILDIFLEEAEEEKDAILEQLPLWLAVPGENAALVRSRRAFHTLKGSGRLVGAQILGDFAWSLENLLNKILEGTVKPGADLTSLLESALEILPQVIECERDRIPHPVKRYKAIADAATALIEGKALPQSGASAQHPKAQPALKQTNPDSLPFDESKALAEELAPPEDVLGQQDSLLYSSWGSADPETLMIESRLAAEMDQVLASGMGILIAMDETIQSIFEPECRTQLKTLDAFVKADSLNRSWHDKQALVQALHTLAESARTAEISPIARLATAAERCAALLLETGLDFGRQDMQLLARCSLQIDQLLGIINAPNAQMPDWKPVLVDLESRLVQLEVEAAPADTQEAEHLAHAQKIDKPWSRSADDTTFVGEDPFLEAMGMTTENPTHRPDTTPSGHPSPVINPPPLALALPKAPLAHELEDFTPEDPELLEIFLEEAQELGERLDRAVQNWLADPDDHAAMDELKRVLHTLKGASRLAGVMQIGDLSHAYESFFIALEHGTLLQNDQLTQIARQVADHLLGQIETLAQSGKIPSSRTWLEILGAAQRGEFSGQGRPTPLKGTDSKTQNQDHNTQADPPASLVTAAPQERAKESEIPEAPDLDPLAELASLEQALGALPDPPATLPKAESLSLEDELKAFEGLDLSLPPLAEFQPEEPEAKTSETKPIKATPAEKTEPPAPAASQPIRVKPSPAPAPAPKPDPATKAAPQFNQPPAPAADAQSKQELIRVRADRLDQMVNNAGEISIFRARIEQQNGIIGFNLDELHQTLYRMRNQLRRLEIETEAQIQFRYDQVREEGSAPDAAFDPLEMDRFSSMQQISRALAETLDDLNNLNETMVETNRTTETLLLQQSRVNNDLQDSLLRTRMVSFSQAVPRLQRLVRQTAQTLGKKGELLVHGGGGELDRSILDRILAPLEHILRNALSHGIETPEERRKKGKSETGQISLSLLREGKDMLVRVEDDGAGINTQAIRKKAIERGLLAPDAVVSEDELIQFLLESGFSTAKEVSQVAGRGVGMDVVVSEVKQLGGLLDISSNPGKGSCFDIRLPFTLSLTETLLVGVGEDIFAVPHTSIEGVIRLSKEQLDACYLGAQEGVSYAGNAYRVHYLAELLGFVETGGNYFPEERKWYPMLLVRHGELRVAIHADRMLGSRQIVVKSVGPQLSTVRWITGGTILADGRVALILDVTTLIRLATRSQAKILRPGDDSYRAIPIADKAPVPKATVMVVDDSVTVRKVTSRLLSRNNLTAVTAKDGVDALGQLQEIMPDVMLLDIEMPRMDGYELTRHIRHDDKLKHIPIIMITSRTGDKHRQLAMELGVNLYLGKPFQEAELLESIRSLLPENQR